jgi:hypothetical protein
MKNLSILLFVIYFASTGLYSALTLSAPVRWSAGDKAPVATTLFAPGTNWSQIEICKYCAEYTTSAGYRVHGASDVCEVIDGANAFACDFAEVAVRSAVIEATLNRFVSLNRAFMEHFTYNLIKKKMVKAGITFADSIESPYFLNLGRYNGGQEEDVRIFTTLYESACAQPTTAADFILYGASRGAAVVYNFLARNYDKQSDKRVRVAVFEGCFDSIANLTPLSYGLPFVTSYKRNSFSPIDEELVRSFVEVCNKENIKVLFVSSDKDRRVPLKNTQNLCEALKKAGLKELYLLVLHGPSHPHYMKDIPSEAERYKAAVHALYAQAGLPHDKKLAKIGEMILQSSKL